MNETLRLLRSQRIWMALAAIFLINMAAYLYGQLPDFDLTKKQADIAVYHELLDIHRETPLPSADEIEQKRVEITAHAILSNPNSFFYDIYKDMYPDILREIEAGNGIKDAKATESAYMMLAEQIKYFENYLLRDGRMQAEFLQKSKSPLFRKQPGTIASMEKTLADFTPIASVTLTLGNDRALESLWDSPVSDYLLLALMALVSLSFITERTSTLWECVYATKNGRTRLAVERLVCLAVFALAGTVLVYLPNLLISFSLYDGYSQLGRSVQSFSMFGKFLIPLDLQNFLFVFIAIRFICTLAAGVVLWGILSQSANAVAAALYMALFLAVEYALYGLSENSAFVAAKYLNLFAFSNPIFLLTSYHNIYVFGKVVNLNRLALGVILPIIVLFTGANILSAFYKKPGRRKTCLSKIASACAGFTARLTPHVPALVREIHKKLIHEKYLLPLCVLVFLAFTYQAPPLRLTQEEVYERAYYRQYCGMQGETLLSQLNLQRESLEDEINTRLVAEETPALGALAVGADIEPLVKKADALGTVLDKAQRQIEANKTRTVKAVMVDPFELEAILGFPGVNYRNQRAMICLLFLVLLFCTDGFLGKAKVRFAAFCCHGTGTPCFVL